MSFEARLQRSDRAPGIAILRIDNPPVNAMSPGVPGAILSLLAEADADPAIKAVLLVAGGNGGFSGADIQFHGKDWPEDEPMLIDLIAGIEALDIPVCALLQRYALGGGLEIALACCWRIAARGTKLGQTEVKLGIPPGAGATQRLPRLIGAKRALDMILSGDPILADYAPEGLLDHVTTTEDSVGEATDTLSRWLSSNPPLKASARKMPPPDPAIFEAARSHAAKRMRGQPAALACIDLVEAANRLPFPEGLAYERERFLGCVASPEAAALRHVFFADRLARNVPGVDRMTARRHVAEAAVIGSGTMGAGITLCLLDAGLPVTLIEDDAAVLERGLARIRETMAKQVTRGRLSARDAETRLARLTPSLDIGAAGSADLVIEAVFEDMELKRRIFSGLSETAKPGAILATNTSYLDIDEIAAAALERKGDVLGLHFFSPANVMPLLEIVRAKTTSPKALATGMALAQRLGKTGVVARICDGFIGNRLYACYIREAEFLAEEGADLADVDAALVEFGMALGPFAVRDLAGLDIGWARRKATAHLRDPGKRYSRIGDLICERGWFGQKTKRGFYRYEDGARTPLPDPEVDALIRQEAETSGISRRRVERAEIVDRCISAIVNEGANLLDEGIALRASDIDLVWINGYGFPRWRGGPMFWAEQTGLAEVLTGIRAFHKQHDFWTPAPLLEKAVAENIGLESAAENLAEQA